MKRIKRSVRMGVAAVGGSSMLMALAACGSGSSDGSETTTLNLMTWESFHDRAWLDEFEEDTGIQVNATNAGSADEMFAAVKSQPGQYDVILVTSGWFDHYVNADLLHPIDESRVEHLETTQLAFDWRAAATSQDTLYGVLYAWGNQPLAWVEGSIPDDGSMDQYLNEDGEPNDWNILWDPAFEGKVSVFDDPTSVLPMIPLALGMENPYDLSDQQFEEVEGKLMDLRPQLRRMTSGFNDQTNQFASGEVTIGILNNIASVEAVAEKGVDLRINNSVKQGVPAWSDNYAITAQSGANKLDAVYEFINYTHSVEWQARFTATSGNTGFMDYEQATSPEAVAAGLDEETLEGTLLPYTQEGDEFFSKQLFFQPVEDLSKRVDLWNRFKLGVE